MNLDEAKQRFIQAWGAFGSQWGINRSMAQVHALLMISPEPLSTEDVMERLGISRGNANMNIRELINWQLVQKVLRPGERKEYFEAEKDVWKIATHVARERKKRELEPMMELLNELKDVKGNTAEANAFKQTVNDIHELSVRLNKIFDKGTRSDVRWFVKAASTLVK